MKIMTSSTRPGILIYLVVFIAAVAGLFWAWYGMTSPNPLLPVMAPVQHSNALGDTAFSPEPPEWSMGDIGKMITASGLSVESLNISSDESQVVARLVSSYEELYALTGRVMLAPGLSISSLSLKKSRNTSQIETTMVLRIANRSTQ